MFIYLMGSWKCFLFKQNKVSIVRLAGRSVNKVYQERPHRISIWNEDKRIISHTIFTSANRDSHLLLFPLSFFVFVLLLFSCLPGASLPVAGSSAGSVSPFSNAKKLICLSLLASAGTSTWRSTGFFFIIKVLIGIGIHTTCQFNKFAS